MKVLLLSRATTIFTLKVIGKQSTGRKKYLYIGTLCMFSNLTPEETNEFHQSHSAFWEQSEPSYGFSRASNLL